MAGRYGHAFLNAYHAGLSVGSGASSKAREAERAAEQSEYRSERLALLCEAMWLLLSEKLGVTDEELIDKLNELDMEDGVLDGKRVVTRGPLRCFKCDRAIGVRMHKCMWCGAAAARSPFE